MRADRVEVTQAGNGPGRIGTMKIFEDLFDHELGLTIGVGRTHREVFGNCRVG